MLLADNLEEIKTSSKGVLEEIKDKIDLDLNMM